jgi:hypothetical protein
MQYRLGSEMILTGIQTRCRCYSDFFVLKTIDKRIN